MDVTQGLQSLLAVFLVAAITPVLVAALPGPRIPQVVFFLIGGVIIGPHALGVADTGSVQLVADAGLGFLFLLAGYELEPGAAAAAARTARDRRLVGHRGAVPCHRGGPRRRRVRA